VIEILANYHAVVDGKDKVFTGVHNLPEEIEKELIERGFAKKTEEKKLTGEQKEAVKTLFLVDGKLTETEPKVESFEPPKEEYTLEKLENLKVTELEALAKEKGIELKGANKEEKAKEIFAVLGA